MIRARKWAWAAVVLPLGLAMAACSGSSGGTDNGSSAPAGEASSAPTGTTPTGNELSVWCWDPNFNIYAMNEAAKIYQKDHPDFKLDVTEVAWDDLQTKLTTIAQAKQEDQLPDIFLVQNNAFQKNVTNYPDLFSDFSGSGIDYSQYPQSVVNYSVVDGTNYGLPFDNGTAVLALRTDVLQQAGYTVKDFTDITWSDFITKAKDIKAKTGLPLLSGQAGSSDTIMMILQSAGASLFDQDGNPAIVGNDALLKAIDVYKQLVQAGVFTEVNSWDEYTGSIVNGSVAGTVNGIWIAGTIESAKDQSGKWDITNLPKLDGVDGATNYSANGGSSWAISSTGNVALAEDFLKSTFAGSTDLYDTILPTSGAIANWIPAGKSDVYSQPVEFFDNDAIYQKVLDYAAKVPANNTGAYYYEARDAVSAAVTKILGGTDSDSALKEAQDTVQFAMQ